MMLNRVPVFQELHARLWAWVRLIHWKSRRKIVGIVVYFFPFGILDGCLQVQFRVRFARHLLHRPPVLCTWLSEFIQLSPISSPYLSHVQSRSISLLLWLFLHFFLFNSCNGYDRQPYARAHAQFLIHRKMSYRSLQAKPVNGQEAFVFFSLFFVQLQRKKRNMVHLTITKWKHKILCENWLLQTASISALMKCICILLSERTFSTWYRRNFIHIWSPNGYK